jgi:hypothetical protein
MKTRRLIYLSAHQATVLRWQAGALIGEGLFEATAEGQQQFAAYLTKHSKSLFALLANVAEEGFQIETIPFLQGADRKAIIGRKFGQLFFNATLTASLSLGREKSRRKDERIMLAALTNNDFFEPWLKVINEAEVALSGIYSMPLLGPSLFRKLKITEERCLLLTVQDQSIRQSYFEKGELHFSRLTPLQNSSIGGIAQTLSAEAIKLQQYLSGRRLLGRGQPITAYILAHSNALKAIEASCADTDTLHFNVLDIEQVAHKIGLKTPPLDTHSEPIFLQLLAAAPPPVQFANDDQRHNFHLWQIRTALYATAAVALFSCLLFAGDQLYHAYNIGQQTAEHQMQAGIARQRYNDVAKTFPPIPTNNETLRRVIDRYVELGKRSTSPDRLYHEISRALQKSPSIEIENIDWKVGGAAAPTGTNSSNAPGSIQVDEGSETAFVRGTLRLSHHTNARQLLAVFNQFVDALKANSKLQVNVLQQPFDIESGKSLKGGETTISEDKPRTFSIQISRKIES